jgi:hypothetical protein
MPRRVAPDDRRTQTVLLRLTESEFETLDVAAHLERVTPNAYAYQLLRSHIASLQTNDHVQRGVENRRSYEASQAATTSLGGSAGNGLKRGAAGTSD